MGGMDGVVKTQRIGNLQVTVLYDQSPQHPLDAGIFDLEGFKVSWPQQQLDSVTSGEITVGGEFESLDDWLDASREEGYSAVEMSRNLYADKSNLSDDTLLYSPVYFADYGGGQCRVTIGEGASILANPVPSAAIYILWKTARQYGLDLQNLLRIADEEVESLQDWYNGNVYGYIVERVCLTCDQVDHKSDYVDDAWGFYDVDEAWSMGVEAAAALAKE